MKRSTLAKLALALPVAALGTIPVPARADGNPQLSEVIKLAQKEGELNVLQSTFGDPQMWSTLQAGVNGKYHIDIRLIGRPGPSSATLAPRLAEEVSAGRKPSSDIILNPPIQQLELNQARVPMPVNWHELDPSIPTAVISKSGSGLVVGGTVFMAVYNANLIPPGSVPRTLDELRNPRFKGLIATTAYGGAWLPIAVARGVGEVTSFLKEIGANGNLKGFIPMTDVQSIASGQFGILLFTDSYVRSKKMIAASAPIVTTSLGVTTGVALSLNIVKGTPSPNLAKLVGLYLASREGQAVLVEHTGYDSPFIPGSTSYTTFETARKRGQKVVIETDALVVDNPQVYGQFAKDYTHLIGAR